MRVGIELFSKFTTCRINANRKKIALGCVDGRSSIISFKDYSNFSLEAPLVTKSNRK